jgi:hypothetical protein
MNKERSGLWLRQKEHIRYLWHRYSVTVNQVMVATVKRSEWWLQLNHTTNPWFSSFLGVRVLWWLVSCILFCRSLFVPLSIFRLLYCLSFFELRLLVIPLVSSDVIYILREDTDANKCMLSWIFIALVHWNNSTFGPVIIIVIISEGEVSSAPHLTPIVSLLLQT